MQMNYSEILGKLDRQALEDFGETLMENLPRAPDTEEEIEEDSFEGFLRREFRSICSASPSTPLTCDIDIGFDTFYPWRVEKGLVLTMEEVWDIYATVLGGKYKRCGLMDFITINKIIDEGNSAHY